MMTNECIIAGEKFTERIRNSDNQITQKIIKILSNTEYDLFQHQDFTFDSARPVFTIILTMHDADINFILQSLDSVFAQEYSNTEVILVNNGARGTVGDLIGKYFLQNKNAKLIHTAKNLYNPTAEILYDPIVNFWNASLFCSQGDFVYFMAYDDYLTPNYSERMVKLFTENANCNTAAPLVKSMNEFGEINKEISSVFENKNRRGRYTNGVALAQSYMRGEGKLMFPGGIFAVKSDLVIKLGGFDSMSDLSQLFKFAIHGDSGFDPEAKLFWRHHANQTNKFQTKLGLVYYHAHKIHNEIYNIKQLHMQVANAKFANEYRDYIELETSKECLGAFRKSYKLSFLSGACALSRIFRECPPHIIFKALFYTVVDLPVIIFYKAYMILYKWPIARKLYRKLTGRSTVGI